MRRFGLIARVAMAILTVSANRFASAWTRQSGVIVVVSSAGVAMVLLWVGDGRPVA